MLSFEDEQPSQSAALGLQLLHSTPSGLTAPAKMPPAGPTNTPAPTPPTRVRA